MDDLIRQFVLLWTVIDPVGTVPVFLAVIARESHIEQRRIAVLATAVAAAVLLFFVVVGELLLEAMAIPLSAFQVAGGIVLFLFALTMIFGDSKPEEEISLVRRGMNTAVFPLAIPSIASPGAMMAAVMLTDNNRFALHEQLVTTLLMMAVLLATLCFMLVATRIQALIGDAGASVISRVMGLVLAAVAVNAVLSGLQLYLGR